MRMLFIILAMFCFWPLAAHAADYEAGIKKTQLYAKLDKAWLESDVSAVKAIVDGGAVKTPQDLETLALWLRNNYVLAIRRDARLGLLYAESLWSIAKPYKAAGKDKEFATIMDTGAMAFYSSQLIAFEDIARCANKGAGAAYSANWIKGDVVKAYNDYAQSLNEDPKIALWLRANILADERETSVADKDACVDTGDTTDVKLVTDEQWKPLRKKINDVVKAKFFKVTVQ